MSNKYEYLKEDVIKAMKNNSSLISFDSKWKDDEDVVMEAIKSTDGDNLKYASDRLKDDNEFIFNALKKNRYLLKYVSNRLKDDKELILKIIDEIDWPGLGYISNRLKDDKEIILKAMEKFEGWLQMASERLQNDKELLEILEKSDISDWHIDYQIWYGERMDVLDLYKEKELMEKNIKVSNKLAKINKF